MAINKFLLGIGIITIFFINLCFASAFSGAGSGTKSNPYNITNCTQLQEMKNNLTASYQLVNNINCSDTLSWNSGSGFEPVGFDASPGDFFNGTFNGNNYNITNLFINRDSTDNVGLFGYSYANISHVGLINVNITGNSNVGGLVGYVGTTGADGIINDSYSTGSVQGSSLVGGLIGGSESSIYNSYSKANVLGTLGGAGGLVGQIMPASGFINNSYATGNITGGDYLGGLAGYALDMIITNSYATGNITGGRDYPNGYNLGGFLGGVANVNISNCYATGNVNGTDAVGGFLGFTDYTTSAYMNINDSYATGDVNGTYGVAGFAGVPTGTISNSYATGKVNGLGNLGGLSGYYSDVTITNCYWYNRSQGLTCADGGSPGCIAISNLNYFYNYESRPMNLTAGNGWNFNSIWDDVYNSTSYPVLQFQQITLPDTTPPYFTTIPANASFFYANQSLSVTFAATDGVGFGYYKINDTRFSITSYANGTGILKNATQMGVGNYEINVTINDSSNNINWTRYTVQINKSNYYDCGVYFNATSPITYPDNFIVYTNCSSAYAIYRNGSAISNASTINSGAGYYNLTVQRTDTANYSNTVDSEFFTVNQNQEKFNVLFNATSPLTYPDVFLVWANSTSAFTLKRNNSVISNNSVQINGAGYFNFSAQRTDTSNYTFNYNESSFTLNKNPEKCQVLYNTTSPLEYPKSFLVWANCTSSFNLYKNGSSIGNNTQQSLGIGAYNFSLQRTDTTNYSFNYNESQFRIVDTTPPYFSTIPANSSLFYSNQSLSVTFAAADAVGFQSYSINDTHFSITSYANGTGILKNATQMAAGNYEINVTINDSTNNINWTRYKVQINKSNYYDCGIYFNATSPLTYPATFIVYTNCSSAYNLYRNGSAISNASTINSGAGYYNLTVQRTDTSNYSNTADSQFFTLNKNQEKCQILYNTTSPLEYPNTFLVWANCTSSFTLYKNGSSISNNSEQSLAVGTYNFSMKRDDNANYTFFYNESSFTISSATKEDSSHGGYSPYTYRLNREFSESGELFGLRKTDKIDFLHKTEGHTMTLDRFDSNSATLTIHSDAISATLTKGITSSFNLDNDLATEIQITYEGIINSKAQFFIQEFIVISGEENAVYPSTGRVEEQTNTANTSNTNTENNNTGPQQGITTTHKTSTWNKLKIILYVFAALVVILVILGVIGKRERKRKGMT